jgi:hypothetical protein
MTDGGIGSARRYDFEATKEYDRVKHEGHLAGVEHLGNKLRVAGLSRLETEVAINRFVSNMTLLEIANKHGFVSAKAVNNLIVSTIIPKLKSCEELLIELSKEGIDNE